MNLLHPLLLPNPAISGPQADVRGQGLRAGRDVEARVAPDAPARNDAGRRRRTVARKCPAEGAAIPPRQIAPRGPPENAPGERLCGPIAEGRKPAGKGPSPGLTPVIRPRLPGRARQRACHGAGRRGRICRRTNPARGKGVPFGDGAMRSGLGLAFGKFDCLLDGVRPKFRRKHQGCGGEARQCR